MRYKITSLRNTTPYSYILWAKTKEEAQQKAYQLDGIPPISIDESPLLPRRIKAQEVFFSLQQLQLMVSAHIPLQDCIYSLKSHTHNPKLAQVFGNIAKSLENGLSLYESFLPHRLIFGNLTLMMIRFGTQSGNLSQCLKLLLDETKLQAQHQKEIKKALTYPCFVLFCTFACFWFLLDLVVPQFVDLFAQNQVSLPIFTQILIIAQETIAQYGVWIVILVGIGTAFLGFEIQTKGLFYPYILSLALHLPFLGKILYTSSLYRYLFTLSILTQAGINLHTSTSLAKESIGPSWIQSKLDQIQTALINGKTLAIGMQESHLFDPLTLNLIEIAQESGKLEEILKVCATNYQTQSQNRIEALIALLEPTLTLLLGGFVLFLALGIFVPIWNLS